LKIIDSRKAFYFYVQNRGETGRLKKIEEDVRQAIAELKQVQAVAPAGADIDRHITSGYKLISDCHAATQL
jgi:tryptophan synthase alpha subunit